MHLGVDVQEPAGNGIDLGGIEARQLDRDAVLFFALVPLLLFGSLVPATSGSPHQVAGVSLHVRHRTQ